MVVPSKIFYPPLCTNHCSQSILHPGIGCLRYFLNNLYNSCLGGFKYFSPLLITPLLLKLKTMDNELFLSTLKYYLKTVGLTAMAASSSFYFICLFRNQLGSFQKYTTLFIPTVFGMQFCWFMPDKTLKLFCTATSQAVFEGILKQFPNLITRLLLHSTSLQTFLFMINSAIILHFKRLKVYKGFWFMQPYGIEKSPSISAAGAAPLGAEGAMENIVDINANIVEHSWKPRNQCVHGQTKCLKFILDGIKVGLTCGIPMDLLNALLKGGVPKGCKGMMKVVAAKLKQFRPNMAGFFLLYGGIYRISSCLLYKYYGHLSRDLQHILAAFLGGASYLWVDKVSFFTLSTVIAIQALWQEFCNRMSAAKKTSSNLVLKLLKDISFSHVIFTLNMGYLVHNFIMNYEVLNSLTRGFLDGLSSNQTRIIRDTITKHSLDELMTIANSHTVKRLL
ncbi:uncharacterized protein LOC101893809 [Musca domestica]|uniref:Uncharacterized protein LOC101893809 n=1 Tax=Musca domestica TaxID=7370 RepID=A0ABM3VQZ3_MUSDO|nr:uncharacterized protein LOC101893809 [Musca domestica]